jgi:excisionase family DNA binding protein
MTARVEDRVIAPPVIPNGEPVPYADHWDAFWAEFDARERGSQWSRDDTPAVLTVDELAALLRVDRKTVYAAIARGEIPGVRRIGSLLRVPRDRVLAWLSQGQDRVSRSRRTR